MATIFYLQLLPIPFAFVFFFLLWRPWKKRILPRNWPVLGMLPALIHNIHKIHDYATDVLRETGGTFKFKGPWFANMDLLGTCDPANIHYILSKNFSNYPKGPEFRKIFDILGDGIFNADHEVWELHRRISMSFLRHPKFNELLQKTVREKVDKGLIPILESIVEQKTEVNLQGLFQRFTFDTICSIILSYDPKTLSSDFPFLACERAFEPAERALAYRHVLPERIWKLQKWLQIGREKELTESWKAFDEFFFHHVSLKRKELEREYREENVCFAKTYMESSDHRVDEYSDKFLRDAFLNLMLAGRDTTSTALSWFFYLIAENPSAEATILQEINDNLQFSEWKSFRIKDLDRLVYLHGALCEALRLYPPVALEHKSPRQPDILPSGHLVDQKTKIILSFYSTGRMESVWGEDWMIFKPERWISAGGGIKHKPSFMFPAFNAGPRTCAGKEMAFIQMKMVAMSIICNYHVQVIDRHLISPDFSIIIHMKHGLKVRISKRSL